MKNTEKSLIFFIDDEPMSNKYNSMLIQRLHSDMEVKTFSSGIDALNDLKIITNRKPELIFLDLYMPEMSGWEFMEELKKNGLDYIEVVILTSSNDSIDKDKAKENSQIKEYMTKPLTNNTFSNFMKKLFKIVNG